ncbi:MAG: hypothetical protein GX199_05390 [Firmicutes bacterium]|nr:hypothetical protein [Bacillota bacterium]
MGKHSPFADSPVNPPAAPVFVSALGVGVASLFAVGANLLLSGARGVAA